MNDCSASAKGGQKFLVDYKKQDKVLLMLIAAIKNANWKFHLPATEQLLLYFNAHDQYNYGQ